MRSEVDTIYLIRISAAMGTTANEFASNPAYQEAISKRRIMRLFNAVFALSQPCYVRVAIGMGTLAERLGVRSRYLRCDRGPVPRAR